MRFGISPSWRIVFKKDTQVFTATFFREDLLHWRKLSNSFKDDGVEREVDDARFSSWLYNLAGNYRTRAHSSC